MFDQISFPSFSRIAISLTAFYRQLPQDHRHLIHHGSLCALALIVDLAIQPIISLLHLEQVRTTIEWTVAGSSAATIVLFCVSSLVIIAKNLLQQVSENPSHDKESNNDNE